MIGYKVLIDFSSSKYTDASFPIFVKQVLDHMTGNPRYPTPDPTLEVVKTAYDNYVDAMGKVKDGTREDTIYKNDMKDILKGTMRSLGTYVQRASNGDEAAIISSGFDVSKKPVPAGPLPAPTGLTVEAGNTRGALDVRWNVVKSARSYDVEYTEFPYTGTTVWGHAVVSQSRVQLDSLTQGRQYAIRVTAIGSDPTRTTSSDVLSYVM
ncbi:fibronectin type III domain-containing protein [Microbacter margulisiae]|uniref:Fibronectin type-III domain-containing protein n=1 Tax=Microbacter margulisiae TaxID=1350067 RepID=A0A7W5DPP9_9PORP|nr:fibronectin type III domain-containing protein [Microbacter margulisiae]MBB3186807.1 hypothetical protein [Microbacter margulisiae]